MIAQKSATMSSVPGTSHDISNSDKRVCKEAEPAVSLGSHRSNTSRVGIEDQEDETWSLAKNINPSSRGDYPTKAKDEGSSIDRGKSVPDGNRGGNDANGCHGNADDEVAAVKESETKKCSRSSRSLLKPASFSHDVLQAAQDALQDQIAADNLLRKGVSEWGLCCSTWVGWVVRNKNYFLLG